MAAKSLGQHWLKDKSALAAVVEAAGIREGDTVLEIGPGLGTLTAVILRSAEKVLAVEIDPKLARNLKQSFAGSKLEVVEADFMDFDLTSLPNRYKVAANLPYYITAPILQRLVYGPNPPLQMGLLVQKEVAERLSARAGQLSMLALSVQNRYKVTAHDIVPAKYFEPPPKVDSQIISLTRRPEPLLGPQEMQVLKLAKAGFGNRRKTLVNSLASVMSIPKPRLDDFLKKVRITEKARAQELTPQQWVELYNQLYN